MVNKSIYLATRWPGVSISGKLRLVTSDSAWRSKSSARIEWIQPEIKRFQVIQDVPGRSNGFRCQEFPESGVWGIRVLQEPFQVSYASFEVPAYDVDGKSHILGDSSGR